MQSFYSISWPKYPTETLHVLTKFLVLGQLSQEKKIKKVKERIDDRIVKYKAAGNSLWSRKLGFTCTK